MAENARVIIYASQISGLFGVGGDAHRENVKLMRSAKGFAILYAPVRSGELKASHHTETRRVAAYTSRGTLWNDAPHAEYVSEGTDGPIYPTGGKFLRLRPGPDFPRYSKVTWVRGQNANDWLERAVDAAVAPYL